MGDDLPACGGSNLGIKYCVPEILENSLVYLYEYIY